MSPGKLVLNADDWGRDSKTTDMTLDCLVAGALSSVSAMVFMSDSTRAAEIARDRGIDAGLHLNLTMAFTTSRIPQGLAEYQQRTCAYLRQNRLAQVVFHPGLRSSFDYVVKAQLDEYQRIYGRAPGRIDGHHHMHLCANVIFQKLLPAGTLARRNLSFERGEKGFGNRTYRRLIDRMLERRHRLFDYLYLLPPLTPTERLQNIFRLAKGHLVEVETHPINPEEHRFLAGGEIFRWLEGQAIATDFAKPEQRN